MPRFLFCYVFVCSLYSFSYAKVNGLIWNELSIEDGLSQALNAFVFKDSRGFVWVSSLSGLNRYDGTTVKVYMPDENDPAAILGEMMQSDFYEDPRGDLWFTTFDAINKYNWENDCFDHYQIMNPQGIPRVGYYIFHQDTQQYLWLLIEFHEMYTFHIPTGTMTFKGNVDTNTVRCLPIVDQHGHVKSVVMRGRDWSGIKISTISGDGKLSTPAWMSESVDLLHYKFKLGLTEGDTSLWLLSPLGLVYYSFKTDSTITYPASGCENVIRLNDSIFLVGTLDHGILTFNTLQRKFIHAPEHAGPRSPLGKYHKVNYMTRDRDGTIWVSTYGIGLHYTHPGKTKFDFINFQDYLSESIEINPLAIYEDQPGKILCFTATDGVYDINMDKQISISPFQPLESLKRYRINNVIRDAKERYWINTWSGNFVFLPATGDLLRVTDSLTIGNSAAATPDGRVYYTTSVTGLYTAGIDEAGRPYYSAVSEVSKDGVYFPVFLDHKNRLWLHQQLREFKIFAPETYEPITSFAVNGYCNAMSMSADEKTIFIGATTGLFEIDEATLTLRKIHTKQTGLPSTTINSILRDERGTLWLGHSNGISAFDPQTGSARAYSVEDGLPPTEYSMASCKLQNGLLCFASNSGLTTFFPDSVQNLQTQAIPQITDLQVNDKKPEFSIVCSESGATHFSAIEKLVFKHRNNTLSFNVNALEYSAPESNTILYTMEGLDEGYLRATNGSRIRYPSMPPGQYRFIMYAHNSDGLQNPVPRILTIVIKPPYYTTWWFITLIALFVFSIMAYIIYLRFSKKLELQNIRLKLYENLHDDVGSRLTAIVLSAEDLEHNENITHPKIKTISRIARSIVANMRRLVWAIDPENDRMSSIIQKINHDKSLILDDQIAFSITVDERIKDIVLPGELRYQISAVCNEAFTNTSKYAAATQVSVRMTRDKKNIKLEISDNGKGFDPEVKNKNTLEGSGYGMANMQRRASRAGGIFKLSSKPGQGTRIEFLFPFKTK